ncbi:hypothetical protein SALBM135S_05593 [Streptomyces alboniger]
MIPKTFWWGFELHLNQEAVDTYLEIKDLIVDVLGEALKEPLASLVAVAALAQKTWVQAISNGYGCKLVSPWISPLMLIPVSLAPSEDTNLWWTVFEPGTDWNTDTKFPGHMSAANPAVAELKGRLYVVHRGASDSKLWWTSYDPDNGWTDDKPFPAHLSADGPALAVYGGRLHCVHRGAGGDTLLYHTSTADGVNWSTDTKMPATSSAGPALAVYNNKLYCVHRGGAEPNLWCTTYDGTRWSAVYKFPRHLTSSNPALAIHNGWRHCVHRGSGGDNNLYATSLNGNGNWTEDAKLPGHLSLEGPALAVFGGKMYCIHRGFGTGDQHLPLRGSGPLLVVLPWCADA